MSLPDALTLCDAIDATWPAADKRVVGPVICRRGLGGGSRVSAATARWPVRADERRAAEDVMRGWGQTPLFMIRPGDVALDAALDAEGYIVKDETVLYAAPVDAIAAVPPPVTAFQVWPPLQSQLDIWAASGIGPDRIAVMTRAACTRTTFLGRVNDRPAGTVYAGLFGSIAMLHALEIGTASRRLGLATHLTRAVAWWGEKQGAATLALATTRANAPANALYASLGMVVVGQYHYRIQPDA